jgi:hypothetical protein
MENAAQNTMFEIARCGIHVVLLKYVIKEI